jgi:transcriptional antiterminator RfaH
MSEAGAPTGAFVPCGRYCDPLFRWLCVHTGPGQEDLAKNRITELGIPAWLPRWRSEGRIRPLFPRYLFVQVDLDAGLWPAIFRQPGVVTILGTRSTRLERPATVPAEVLDILWQQCAADGVIYPPEPAPVDRTTPIPCGTKVQLASGAMIGLTGICLWSDGKRVRLLLEILGRGVAVTVPRATALAVPVAIPEAV